MKPIKEYNVGTNNHKIINLLAHYGIVHQISPSDLITAYKVLDYGKHFVVLNTKKAILSVIK